MHPGRFLPGAAKLWIEAGKTIVLSGSAQLGNFYMSSIRLGSFVTAKGWVEPANPSPTKLSIQHFNINNYRAKTSNVKDNGDSELMEFTAIGEFQLHGPTYTLDSRHVCEQWNLSFTALENFLHGQQLILQGGHKLTQQTGPAVNILHG